MTTHRGDACIKLVLLGNGSVGKSSLIARFVADGFTRVYKQTAGLDFFEKTLAFPRDQRVVLQVWDIGGQTIGSKMMLKYLFGAHAALVCYDVTDAQSFSDAEDWPAVARQSMGGRDGSQDRPPSQQEHIYLVGNKIDLIAQRVVTKARHDEFVRRHGLRGGFLVSAQSGDQVLKAVYRVSAAAAGIRVSEFELSFCDQVVRATIPCNAGDSSGAGDASEPRTAMADAIEAEDRALEAREKAKAQTGAQCCVM